MIRELIKDMAKYLPSVFAPAMVGIMAIPIITRLFLPGEYGNYILVITTVSVLSTVTTGWLNNSIIRFYPSYELKDRLEQFHDTVLKMALISIAAISLIVFIILFLGRNHMSSSLNSLMQIGLLVFIATACSHVLLHFLMAKRQVTWYTSFSIWHSVAGLGLGVALVMVWHFEIEGLLWGSLLSTVVALPLLWKFAVGKGISLKQGISLPITSEMTKYGFPLVGGFLTFWILSLSDRYFLEFFWGSHEVGIYSVSYGISETTIFMLSSLFIMASGPISMNIWEKQGIVASQEFLTKLTRYYLLICIPVVVGLSVLAKPIIDIMTTPAYYEGYRIVPLVVFGAFFVGLAQRFQSPLTYYKKTNLVMGCTVVAALLNIGLNFLLVPKYGYIAAAATTLACYVFFFLLMVLASRNFFVWEFPFKFLWKAVGASWVMGITVYYIGNSFTSSVLMNLIVAICVGVMVYSIVLFLLRGFQADEIETLLAFGRRVTKR